MCQTCSSNCCKCSLTQGVCINKDIMRAVVFQTKANLQKPLLHWRHTENFIHHAAFSSTARLFLVVKQMYVQVISVKLVAVVLKSSQGQKTMMRQSRFQNSQDMCYGLAGVVQSWLSCTLLTLPALFVFVYRFICLITSLHHLQSRSDSLEIVVAFPKRKKWLNRDELMAFIGVLLLYRIAWRLNCIQLRDLTYQCLHVVRSKKWKVTPFTNCNLYHLL